MYGTALAQIEAPAWTSNELEPSLPCSMFFGDYVAHPAARTLLLAGRPVCLGARAFDLLVLLLALRGSVVSKQRIMQYVWPTTTVDESNLRFQITELRKALGRDREMIKTIPGRGYILAADVGQTVAHAEAANSEPRGAAQGKEQSVLSALRVLLEALAPHSTAIPAALSLLEGSALSEC